MNDAVSSLIDPQLVRRVGELSMPDVRQFRARASAAESDVSLVRRITQGRLDILGHEIRRRAGDAQAGSALPALLFDLPSLMTDASASAPLGIPSRAISIEEPGALAVELVERVDAVVSPSALASVGDLSDAQLQELVDQLERMEQELSSLRRALHETIDGLQAEMVRRYRDGEASVDSVFE